MNISKRSLPVFIILNCLTLGIYGFIVGNQINNEVNALCKGDKEQPMGYSVAVIFRAIPAFLGLLVGFIVGLIGVGGLSALSSIGLGMYGGIVQDAKAAVLFLTMAIFAAYFGAIGSIISGIYHKYWWYRQANRLKLNAHRYGLTVKETGADHFMFRTILQILFIPVSVILLVLSFLVPIFFIWLLLLAESVGAIVFACILLFLFVCTYVVFGGENTVGAYISMAYIIKTLNRYSEVYRNGAKAFDDMGYEYYPSLQAKYPGYLNGVLNGRPAAVVDIPSEDPTPIPTPFEGGILLGVKGTNAGYKFDLAPYEEIIIGKDAKEAMVVIETAYKEVSRKHVGVTFDITRNQYRVVDYSSNGTWANGSKLVRGQEYYLPRDTELKLANGKNIFQLG